jgi:hypothetical protein
MKIQPLHQLHRSDSHQRQLLGMIASIIGGSSMMGINSLSFAASLGLGSLSTLGISVWHLAMPPAVTAYTVEDLLTITWVAGEDYTALARRAEYAARTSAQQRFDADILLTHVVITVLGQNGGETAPILVMDVNRADWRNRPDPRYWSKYYRSTAILLELEGVPATGTLQPAPTTGTQPAPVVTPPPPVPENLPPTSLPEGSGAPVESPTPADSPAETPADSATPPSDPTRPPSSTRRSPGRSVRDQSTPLAPQSTPQSTPQATP